MGSLQGQMTAAVLIMVYNFSDSISSPSRLIPFFRACLAWRALMAAPCKREAACLCEAAIEKSCDMGQYMHSSMMRMCEGCTFWQETVELTGGAARVLNAFLESAVLASLKPGIFEVDILSYPDFSSHLAVSFCCGRSFSKRL